MARSVVVVAHPRPGSFVHALADAARSALVERGHDIVVHDLYADRFDPVERPAPTRDDRDDRGDALAARYRRDLASAHTLVVAHPNWWGKPPALMAGWIDRVVVPGVAYELPDPAGEPVCLLDLERLVVLNTGDTPLQREREAFGDPLADVWERCVGTYLGAPTTRLYATPLAGSTEGQRREWLAGARRAAVAV